MAFKGKPKLCNLGCNTDIGWYHDDETGEEFYAEINENNQFVRRHKCPKWNVYSNNRHTGPGKLQHNEQAQIVDEIQVLPLDEANKLLSIEDTKEYELVGSDPVKVVHDEFFIVIGKKSFDPNRD